MTYSIIAVDPDTAAAGAGSITGGMAVGAFVPCARAGAGAVATQGASTNWLYGERGLALLEQGTPAAEVLDALVADDRGREYRQCIIVDAAGNAAGRTGNRCEAAREHRLADGVAAAGNMLAREGIAHAMLEAFRRSSRLPFAERLLAALRAGEDAGGDDRGIVSAALCVDYLDHPPLDIRIDYQPDSALDALFDLHHRYRSAPFSHFCATVPTRSDYGKHQR